MGAPTLVTIRPGVQLAPDAAAAFQRYEAALGRQADVNSAYRDWDEQYQLWLDYQNGVPGAPYALHPDDSMHCKGLAFDTDDRNTLMDEHGLIATATNVGEPWHRDYIKDRDRHYGEPAGGDAQPFPQTTTEDIMNYIRIKGKSGARRGGTYAVFNDGAGKFSALYVGSGGPSDLGEVTSEDQIAALQKKITGLK